MSLSSDKIDVVQSPTSPSSQSGEFQPFVSASQNVPELTLKAVLLGLFFAIVFGMSSVYLALCAGLTVGGSIPIAVIVIGLFKRYGKSTILENNMVQTIGSAGESVASGVVYTTIALTFLVGGDRYFHYTQIMTLGIVGGLLGILFMIPLRRSLIVKEHGNLRYPEGTACAEVLVAGEKQGDLALPVFMGSLVAACYWILMKMFGLWKEIPHLIHRKAQDFYPNATLTVDVTPEYLGIGYVIGPRVTIQMLAGGLFAWLVLIPLFSAYPGLASLLKVKDVFTTMKDLGMAVVADQALPSAAQVHIAYVKYMAVGAVVGAGVITLLKTMPVIVGALKNLVGALRAGSSKAQLRTEKDLPMWIVVVGAVVMVLLIAILPNLPGKFPSSLLLSLLIVVFGFFFVTVSSRFVGVAGYSIEPVSPMMFTTVMATCLIFILLGWTSENDQAVVVLIGAVVCISAGIAGATSQDLKTGFLLGATPRKQQFGLFIGVILSALVVGGTVLLIDHSIPNVRHAIGYIAPGQDAPKFGAPQATILSMLIKAVLGGKMPWALVILGALLSIVIELTGAMALAVAAGFYLPLSTTTAIFAGSVIRWLVMKRKARQSALGDHAKDGELSKGMLYATGLVAGGSMSGMALGFFDGFLPRAAKWINVGKEYWNHNEHLGNGIAIVAFFAIGLTVYLYGRKDQQGAATHG